MRTPVVPDSTEPDGTAAVGARQPRAASRPRRRRDREARRDDDDGEPRLMSLSPAVYIATSRPSSVNVRPTRFSTESTAHAMPATANSRNHGHWGALIFGSASAVCTLQDGMRGPAGACSVRPKRGAVPSLP